ncbi:PREDICTED: dirigent protein 9-like isoform X1 [Tarenaya hassleriana]|uniref:dirigent protein 9-like isoform X2 n=1 Tax=Tarenaya hassleriana TaxID=28532 RepID=UPI00053C7F4D|nr:PREDICTED: dirigent protein 9-like isoform X2 [Tarenaya hassleriana]XP_019057692.1 PREDICTED: dirigent protein 9-like isoform X1 [Tarenaya hassleriana]
MAKSLSLTLVLFLVVSNVLTIVHSARLLDQVEAQPQVLPQQPSGQTPAIAPPEPGPADQEGDDDSDDNPQAAAANPTAAAAAKPLPTPTTTTGPVGAAAAAVGGSGHEPDLAFFMHDVLGGSHPSARVVTGIVAQTEVNGIPFSKANNNIFPVDNAIPLVNLNNINKIINPNTAPLLTGLTGAQASTIIQSTNGNSNNALNSNNLPFVTAGQLPPAAALQQLMFGTITVVDDELTESHELGSAVIGRAQGFYLASSLDGTSQTLALTVLLHGGEHGNHDTVDDAISFFGVHRSASTASQIAVVGGTGRYEHAKGYAVVETLHNQDNQHITDGIDTILHFSVYLTYKA